MYYKQYFFRAYYLFILDDGIKLPVTTETITHVSSKISGLNYIFPSNVFQQYKQSLLLGISCTERLANDLCHADLVSDQVRDEVITTPNLSRFQRANRLLSNFEQYLKTYNEIKSLTSFCDVLKQQDDPTVARISDEILEMLGKYSFKMTRRNNQNLHRMVVCSLII